MYGNGDFLIKTIKIIENFTKIKNNGDKWGSSRWSDPFFATCSLRFPTRMCVCPIWCAQTLPFTISHHLCVFLCLCTCPCRSFLSKLHIYFSTPLYIHPRTLCSLITSFVTSLDSEKKVSLRLQSRFSLSVLCFFLKIKFK